MVDEVRLVSHQSEQRGSTGIQLPLAPSAIARSMSSKAHGPHAWRRSKTSGEQLIDAKRARTLGDTCRLRRILCGFVRGLLDETQAISERKPPNRG
ncbi:MAG TPA: hypothetical protein VGJ91_00135 [Polyangiaceae bacterium]